MKFRLKGPKCPKSQGGLHFFVDNKCIHCGKVPFISLKEKEKALAHDNSGNNSQLQGY